MTSKRVVLFRNVNEKSRYYSIEINPTLFGEILLTREYGGVKNKRPTRVIKEYYSHLEDSQKAMERLVYEKIKKGYMQKNIQQEL